MQNSLVATIKKIRSLGKWKNLAAYTCGAAVKSALTVAVPLLLGLFIDRLVYGGDAHLFFLLLLGAAVLAWLIELLLRKAIIQIARNAEKEVQYRLLDALQTLKPAAFDRYPTGEIAIKFYRDAGALEQFVAQIYPTFLNLLWGFFFALLAILSKNPWIALLYLAFLPLLLLSLVCFTQKLTRSTHSIRSMYDHSINHTFELMNALPFLKSMAAAKPYFRTVGTTFGTYKSINRINDRVTVDFEFCNRFILLVGEYSILAIAGYMAWKKLLPIGDVVMFQILFLSLFNSFSGILQLLPNWKATQESLNSIFELLSDPNRESAEKRPPIPTAFAELSAENITFGYNENSRVFADFSCRITPGSVVAVVGTNGCGKTTLLKLLTGYLAPDRGQIKIAGRDISSWQIESLRQKISYVLQDPILIAGTIRDNITLRNPTYTEKEIAEALRLSGADELISRLPDGLDHPIRFGGSGLSGGERQKLAIARALIRRPQILVFDEVTNHLDHRSRLKMRDLLGKLRQSATILLVSHDPEILQYCDQTINLE